jgi:two-component system response regulator TctD
LIQRSGEPLSKQQIIDRVFADETDVQQEAVEVLIHRVRKRLESSPLRIVTLRGLGYLLEQRQ